MTSSSQGTTLESNGTDVVIMARNNLRRDARVEKESRSLAQAGLSVARVGIVVTSDDTEFETTPFDTVVRVRTTERLAATGDAGPAGSSTSAYRGLVGSLRHWLGRQRENRFIARRVIQLKPRIVIACDVTTLPAGVAVARACGSRLIYDAHELYTETASVSRLFKILYGATERRGIHRADAVLTVSEPRARELSRRYGVSTPVVVMNGPTACVAAQPDPVGQPLRLFYQGGYSRSRYLEELIAAMDGLQDVAHLTLQGFGELEAVLRSRVTELGLSGTVNFIEPCEPSQVVDSARGYDVGIALYRSDSLNNYLASPNKTFDYMAAGLAIIASRLPVLEVTVESNGCGLLVDAQADAAVLATAIRALAEDPDRVLTMKRSAIEVCPGYTWEVQAAPLVRLVKSFAGVTA